MKTSWAITGTDQRVQRLRYRAPDGRTKTISPVFTPYHGGSPVCQGGEERRGHPEGLFKRPRPSGRGTGFTVKEVCQRLRKSRRQVYRYLRMGRLRPCAQVLGQWLFAPADIARWTTQGLPKRLRVFFWDVSFSSLSSREHRDFILGRLLELGDREAIRWVFRTYPRPALVAFLKGRGTDVLSRRNWHFWSSQLGIDRKGLRASSWRHAGRSWGGIQ